MLTRSTNHQTHKSMSCMLAACAVGLIGASAANANPIFSSEEHQTQVTLGSDSGCGKGSCGKDDAGAKAAKDKHDKVKGKEGSCKGKEGSCKGKENSCKGKEGSCKSK